MKKLLSLIISAVMVVTAIPFGAISVVAAEHFTTGTEFNNWYENEAKTVKADHYIGILTGEQPESCAMCGVCGNYFALEADGSLYPCDFYCREEYKLGNISDENPFEMNEKQKAFIEQSLLIHGRCKDCEYYALCRGGCRRDRTDGYIKNKYCVAYKGFFDYAAGRMLRIAAAINNK